MFRVLWIVLGLYTAAFAFAASAWLIKPDRGMAVAGLVDQVIANEEFQALLVQAIDKYDILQKKRFSLGSAFQRSDPWYLFTLLSGPEAAKLLVAKSVPVVENYSRDYQRAFQWFRIAAMIAVFATFVAIFGAMRSFWSQSGYVPSEEAERGERLKNVVADLRERAANQRNQGALILLTIGGACATSFLLFYTAEDLISSRFDKSMMALEDSVLELNVEVSELSQELTYAIEMISSNAEMGESVSRPTELALQSLNSILNSSRFTELASIPAQSMVVAQEGKNTLVSTLLVRVGSITIAIFIVLMLAPAYRYSTSLASFYDSRADSLSLSAVEDADLFRLLIEHLDPPRHETEKASIVNLASRIKHATHNPNKVE